MKTKKKALLLVMCALLLVGATVMGTLAYLTDTTTEVENTFTIGKVEITLDEADLGENAVEGARTEEGNTYENVIPGGEYDKDPTVHVAAGSQEAAIVAVVTSTDLDDDCWNDTLGSGWMLNNEYTDEASGVYVYTYNTAVAAEENTTALFTKVTLPNDFNEEEVTITVKAGAIQNGSFNTVAAAQAQLLSEMYPPATP